MEVVKYEVSPRARFDVRLDDYFPAKKGGIEVWANSGGCTLGFNVKFSKPGGTYAYRGFVTNSHCTRTFGLLDSTVFFQGSPDRIGVEISDKQFSQSVSFCPLGARCRYSDAALVHYDAGVVSAGAKVARTGFRDPQWGSTLIDDDNPQFTVTGIGYPGVGTIVDKIGVTTGWTYGEVISGCWDQAPYPDGALILLCQLKTTYGSDPGDSGAPVFIYDGTSNVALVGIHWGNVGSALASWYDDIPYELSFGPWRIAGF
ncbi:MAG: hypothetical protein WKF55_08260 [Gemmatimonadaceae bacterium]